jgi:hypothetical protein
MGLPEDRIEETVGKVVLDPPGPIIAGSVGQWRFIFTAGAYGIDEGGTIILSQRTACDWEIPQMDHPHKSGYTSVETEASVRLDAGFEPKKDIRPWQKWCFVIDVHDGFIAPGETVVITLGDRSNGSPGIRSQTFVEKLHEFRFAVDPTNANMPAHLPSSPVVSIVPGEAKQLICTIPSQLAVGRKATYHIRADDKWGNPAAVDDKVKVRSSNTNVAKIKTNQIVAGQPGNYGLRVTSGPLTCESNPGVVAEVPQQFNRYWGDLHAQTGSTVGTGTDDEYFQFARDQAHLDFTSHQANDFMVSDQAWADLSRTIKRYHSPGQFVVFPGYEWSGNTPCGGDHNVIYLNDDQPIYRSSHWQIPEVPETRLSPANPVTRLYELFKNNKDVILIPHVGGRYADTRKYFEPNLIPLVEIVSCWGVFEWMLWDALDMGYKTGIVCNSDGHKGRPGAEGPGAGAFGIPGGLTCVLAEELTRESIFKALQQRRCYGTTGPRLLLDFKANGEPMGTEIRSDEPVELTAEVIGTGPLEALVLFNGREIIKQVAPEAFQDVTDSKRLRISWGGARIRGRTRKARWDGSIRVAGCKIVDAHIFAFDTPANGITERSDSHIDFRSGTTGDVDGIDLFIDDLRSGRIYFDSPIGSCQIDLADISIKPAVFDFGGLNLHVAFRRYPETLQQRRLTLSHAVNPVTEGSEPYYIKAIQADGHMAWASPVFITRAG